MLRGFALFILLLGSDGVASPEGIGLQAFNWTFREVTARLPEIVAHGYTHVQVSPPQKSIPDPVWWGRYQPVDFRVIEGPLGSERDFARMNEEADRLGVRIVVDVVLNHMASTSADLTYPQFMASHFHFPETRPCIRNWLDRREVTQHWLCFGSGPGLPDLDTSQEHVRRVHRRYLEKLIALGADGFRVDAAKHVEVPYFRAVLKDLPAWTYGEVIGSTFSESGEYFEAMDVSDFHWLGGMLDAFNSPSSDLRKLLGLPRLAPDRSVVFVRNHDTAMSENFFRFRDPRDHPLATAFMLGMGGGFPMIFSGDFRDPSVRAGVAFHRRMAGRPASIERNVCRECDAKDLLFIARGDAGLVIINRGESWFRSAEAGFDALLPGCYREITHGFEMEVGADRRIRRWANASGNRLEIGGKTALYFAPVPAIQCLQARRSDQPLGRR